MKYKIFISYSSLDKKITGSISRAFEEHNKIECFLAHDDIDPGSEWEKEIIKNLNSSNFFMPVLTKNLEISCWCQQEAGYALAKEIKIIPLMLDTDYNEPVGFCAKFQGYKLRTDDLRGSIKNLLIKEEIVQQDNSSEIEKLIYIFSNSNTWEEAYETFQPLQEIEDQLTNADIIRIADSAAKNDQIHGSFALRDDLRKFIRKNSKIISDDIIKKFI